MGRANARFLYTRYPKTGTAEVGDEADQLERHLREGSWPQEAMSPKERGKQEVRPY